MSKIENDEENRPKYLLCFVLCMVINCLMCFCSMVARVSRISGAEIAFVRGFVQCIVFSTLEIAQMRNDIRRTTTDLEVGINTSRVPGNFPYLPVLSFSLMVAVIMVTHYLGVKLIPVSDLIVLCYVCPVFTIFLSAIILKTKVTAAKAMLSLLLVFGVVLVMQPVMLFGDSRQISGSEKAKTWSYEDSNYALGIPVGLCTALASSIMYVLVSKTRLECPTALLMAASGLATLLISFVCPLLGIENRILGAFFELELQNWLMICVVALGSMISGLLIVLVSRLAPPTFVVMNRSLELLVTIGVECVVFHRFPSAMSGAGAAVVVAAVVLMPFADQNNSN